MFFSEKRGRQRQGLVVKHRPGTVSLGKYRSWTAESSTWTSYRGSGHQIWFKICPTVTSYSDISSYFPLWIALSSRFQWRISPLLLLLVSFQNLVRKPNITLNSFSSWAWPSCGFSNHHFHFSCHNQDRTWMNQIHSLFTVFYLPSNTEKQEKTAKWEDKKGQGHGFLAAYPINNP